MNKLLIRGLALGCAAGIGYSTRPPIDELHIGLFHACFSCLLAVMVWGVFHLLGLHHLPRYRALAAGAISVLLWALLLAGLVAVLRGAEGKHEDLYDRRNYTNQPRLPKPGVYLGEYRASLVRPGYDYRPPAMRAQRAKLKSCKDDMIIAQGKRSAALGRGPKTISSPDRSRHKPLDSIRVLSTFKT